MDKSSKIPLFVIFLVIIFVIVVVIILSSYGSSEKTIEKPALKIKSKKEKKITFNDINVSPVHVKKESDSLTFEFSDLTHDITYIFGSEFDNSSISIYKEIDDKYTLVSTNVYSGNHGFVLSSNPLNVNASYFQLGTKLDLENIKYNCIYLEQNYKYKVITNNIISSIYKAYRFTINYKIKKSDNIIKKSLQHSFGLSEYDLEHKIKFDNPNIKERFPLTRLCLKQWEFKKEGTFLLSYITNRYNFVIKNKTNGNEWKSEKTSNEYNLHYEIIHNPDLLVKNLDETINSKTFNTELIGFLNTPFTLYDHFLHGPKVKKVDVLNRISNKILIFSL